MTAKLILKPGREKTVLRKHPWLFSGAVAKLEGEVENGSTVAVVASGGQTLGYAAYSQYSQISARMWSYTPDSLVTADYIGHLVQKAVDFRTKLGLSTLSNAFRLVHAESDGLPGLIADQYDEVIVVQFLSAGAEYWKEVIVDALMTSTGRRIVYERSDADVRKLEGLPERTGLLRGSKLPEPHLIHENQIQYQVDLVHGQKTGFYLDQRANRRIVGQLSSGRRVLNCFCYTGGFSLSALQGGASEVVSIDSSADALDLARTNQTVNGFASDRATWMEADVFQALRQMRDRDEHFDLIILDPPKFAPTAAQVDRAARAYKDINLLGFKLLNPGGILATFSCSGGVSAELFQKIVADAAVDARCDAYVLRRLSQDVDHPIALAFPEGEYLKGLVVKKQ